MLTAYNRISIFRDVEKSKVGKRRIKRMREKKESNEENQKNEGTSARMSKEPKEHKKKIICFKICTANRIPAITAFHTTARKPTTRAIKKKPEQIGNDLLKYARSEIGNTNTLCRKAHSMGRKNVCEMWELLVLARMKGIIYSSVFRQSELMVFSSPFHNDCTKWIETSIEYWPSWTEEKKTTKTIQEGVRWV